MRSTEMRSRFGWQSQFVLLALIWGSSFLFIKVLGEHWSALWVAFARIALGAITLSALVLLRREHFPRSRRLWLQCAVAALLFNAVPWTLFAYGEQHTTSVVAGLWNATTPLWTVLVSLVAFHEQRPTRALIAAIGVGFLGVVVLLGPWRGIGGSQLIGLLACGAAALSYGIGFNYTRRHLAGRVESGIVLSACQLICGTAILVPFAALAPFPTELTLAGAGSLLALGTLASGVAFAINFAIVRARGAAVASTVTYLMPIVSTVLGAIVLGEAVHWNQPVGTAILLGGIAASRGGLRRVRRLRRRPRVLPAPAGTSARHPHPRPQTASARAEPAHSQGPDGAPPTLAPRARRRSGGDDIATTAPPRT
jgi:drug/metabolite transporter (DMT)-like permease